MKSIASIGMDVHTTNYTLCAYTLESQKPFAQIQIHPDLGGVPYVVVKGLLGTSDVVS